uniref:Uncharacterized protein n=1 Tax=Oryza sativa subsp. japonica TaxID=39947 RepID=Q5Z6Q0_ORYSJ|nr:hypothetical protein [Oryza sativa Japonica Group]
MGALYRRISCHQKRHILREIQAGTAPGKLDNGVRFGGECVLRQGINIKPIPAVQLEKMGTPPFV